ncbi:hypothetical protein IFR04_009138 [Cadophora malorum]|uniref:Uncharacterized protein n=1 Tax=Cadophora malorum TaxID=108018 RepID=A0A8H7TD87_9HELO|nr:hypothetical protein IFR04_009138 [Cadophora malorum]
MDPSPITEDQESTLRRWASTVKTRPRKRDKAFLRADKGLSSKQIDHWWKKNDQSMGSASSTSWTPASIAEDKAPGYFRGFGNTNAEMIEHDFQGQTLSNDTLGDLGGDFSTFSTIASQEALEWSLNPTQDEPSSSYLSLAASSMIDTVPLLSPSSRHLSCATGSDRSSYGSALTWGTSSTLASICDHYGDDHSGVEQELSMCPVDKLSRLVKKGHYTSTFTSCDTIAENDPPGVLLLASRTSRRAKSINNTLPDTPRDHTREQGKYQCTACHWSFSRRFIHIAEHYEKQVGPLPRWSMSLVIKGLLRQQKRDDFKIYEIWKELMGASPNSDRLIEWSEAASASLKRKLEFNEGSAREVATEAQRMALFPNPSLGQVAWTSDDSRVTTLVTPMVLEIGVEPWQEHTEAQGSRMLEAAEASMAGYF